MRDSYPGHEVKRTFDAMRHRTEGIRFADVRPARLVYFLAYALELVLFDIAQQYLSIGGPVFGIRGWTVALALHMVGSLVIMLLWSERFKRLIYISLGIMIAGFIPFVLLPASALKTACALVFYAGLGGAVTGCRCGYAFATNNAEKLAGMMLMFGTVAVFRYIYSLGAQGVFCSYVLPFVLVTALCTCLLHFRERDFEVKEVATEADTKGLYWAFAFFILFFTFDGYNVTLIVERNNPDYLLFFIGMLLAGGVLFVGIAKLRLNTWFMWSVFFAASLGMALFALFSVQMGTEAPQYFFGGLAMIGWPLCIYMLGCAQRRFASYKLLKKCTLIYVVVSPVCTMSSKIAYGLAPASPPLVATVFILVAGIAFLLLSPLSYKHLFSADWISDIYKPDMALLKDAVEDVDRFDGFALTPRQKEIAVLLLAAKTRRQIAAELGVSESTVKMHVSDLYKRLGVRSRTELFRRFGVSDGE